MHPNDTKEYFIQYLPVDGEIEDGDVYLSNRNDERILRHKKGLFLYGKQKLKPFVCSRNVNDGDTRINMWIRKHGTLISDKKNATFDGFLPSGRANMVYDGGSSSVEYPFNPNPEVPDLHGFTGDIYKVIGEVSKDATWVTEGMRFDKEEIDISLFSTQSRVIVNIKCPTCKHYH